MGWSMRRKEVDREKDATAKRYKDAEMETGPKDGLDQEMMALGMRWSGEDLVRLRSLMVDFDNLMDEYEVPQTRRAKYFIKFAEDDNDDYVRWLHWAEEYGSQSWARFAKEARDYHPLPDNVGSPSHTDALDRFLDADASSLDLSSWRRRLPDPGEEGAPWFTGDPHDVRAFVAKFATMAIQQQCPITLWKRLIVRYMALDDRRMWQSEGVFRDTSSWHVFIRRTVSSHYPVLAPNRWTEVWYAKSRDMPDASIRRTFVRDIPEAALPHFEGILRPADGRQAVIPPAHAPSPPPAYIPAHPGIAEGSGASRGRHDHPQLPFGGVQSVQRRGSPLRQYDPAPPDHRYEVVHMFEVVPMDEQVDEEMSDEDRQRILAAFIYGEEEEYEEAVRAIDEEQMWEADEDAIMEEEYFEDLVYGSHEYRGLLKKGQMC